MNLRAKNWCFTINNPTEEDNYEKLKDSGYLQYIIVGHETGEDGTPHFQGYIQLTCKKKKVQFFERMFTQSTP